MKTRIRLADRLGGKGYHTTIVTTFGVDFDVYENIALTRLRGSNCRNNLLLVDARMLTYALDGASVLPRFAGKDYSVVGCSAGRVFHPKIVLQLGRKSARLIVSSANVTSPGMGGNLEIAGQIDVNPDDLGERQLAAAALYYLLGHLQSASESLLYQTSWLIRRCRWLSDAPPAVGAVLLADGTQAAFLASGEPKGIGRRFVELVDRARIHRLIILSPYWDNDLRALRYLVDQLKPRETVVLVDVEKALFPRDALKHLPGIKILDIHEQAQPSFVHAKAIIAQSDGADHLLYGSANCTVAALGLADYAGDNEEASLYRRLPVNHAIDALQLEAVLANATVVNASALPEIHLDESIPLEQAASRHPGHFELQGDVLSWWPPKQCDSEAVNIELLDVEGLVLELPMNTLVREGPDRPRRIRLREVTQPPAFARLRKATGDFSAPAVISVIDDIYASVREVHGKKTEEAARILSDHMEEGLWLLETMETLENADLRLPSEQGAPNRAKAVHQGKDASPEESTTMAYEEFVATRRQRNDAFSMSRNDLAGTNLSLVQACLNRILGIGRSSERQENAIDPQAAQRALDLGDEVGNGEGAIEAGEEVSSNPSNGRPTALRKGASDNDDERSQVDAGEYALAVSKHIQKVWDRAKSHQLTSFDVLRLRAALMVVAVASTGETQRALLTVRKADRNQGPLRLLPVDGDRSWVKFMCNLLFTFFGGKDPAIKYVQISPQHDQVPTDIQECWATAVWAIHACRLATATMGNGSLLTAKIPEFTDKIYASLGLQRDQLTAPTFVQVIEALNQRFADRFGYDTTQLAELHHAACAKIQ